MAAVEGGKGVMMSERPAPSGGGAAGGGGGGGGDGGVSIGNFKGVMLCNRPFAGGQGAAKAAAGGASGAGESSTGVMQPPFLGGKPFEPLHPRGVDPSTRERKQTVAERSKSGTALSRHKKWLRDLQRQREHMRELVMEEQRVQERKARKFAETQKKMRDAVRGVNTEGEAKDDLPMRDGDSGDDRAEGKAGESKAGGASELQAAILSAAQEKKVAKAKKGGNVPAWAVTEEEKERLEDEEADELLDFAANLDYDAFVDDVEVLAAIEQAQSALKELEAEEEEEKRAAREAERKAAHEEARKARAEGDDAEEGKSHRAELTEDNLSQWNEELGERAPGDAGHDSKSVAESLLSRASAAESIRSVHSKKSLAAVVAREKHAAASPLPAISEDKPARPAPVVPPLIVVVDESGGAREKKKKHVSQLPYMNRNPSV